ncbi:MAG TPA: histidinol dehydrogenase [Armatimonadota bacterium]|nr:histidinol dehydrogenase [Armatimonadota bacterium]
MRFLNTQTDPPARITAALTQSNSLDLPEVEAAVRAILADVRARGDAAVRDCLRRYDGVELEALEASEAEYAAAERAVDPEFRRAVEVSIANVRAFHERQREESWTHEEDGACLGHVVRPLARVGIHAPGGKAPLPSTVIMAAVPARVAGVREVIACSPPRKDGTANPFTLFAARAAGVDRFYKMGGAQGIAAMAFGTESVPRVDKIVGPGNPYTVLAKRLVFGHVDIESLPGPTEVVVIADDTADPRWVAADLLSQAEHGADSLVVLLTPSERLGRAVAAETERQAATLSRADTVRECLAAHGWVIVTRDLAEACELASRCAPEHLELVVADPDAWVDRIENAGAIFIGPYTPEPIGDYIAGPSHILPTGGTARFSSPLHLDDFVKKTSILRYSRERFEREAAHVIRLAEAETLDAHANAVRVRLEGGGGPPRQT